MTTCSPWRGGRGAKVCSRSSRRRSGDRSTPARTRRLGHVRQERRRALQLEAVRPLHQQLFAVAQGERVLELVARVETAEGLQLCKRTATHISDIEIGQRRQFVAIADLEAEVAHPDIG